MIKKTELTRRQAEVLAFVEKRQQDVGIYPSHKEIAAHFGFQSTYSVREHLRLIEKKGFLYRIPGNSRSLRITKHCKENDIERMGIPLLGSIAAGQPQEAIQNAENSIPVAPGMFHGQKLFALRVRGESMIGVGILDGDIAILNYQTEVNHGEIAAVLIENEATLKRVLRTPRGVSLHAENPVYPDIPISSNGGRELRIAGRLVGIIRTI